MASNAAAFDGDAVAHLTDIVANFQSFVRELREQREGGDAATLDRDVCIWLHTLTQMIEGVQQELLPNQKKRKRESLLDVGDDPKPAADVAIADIRQDERERVQQELLADQKKPEEELRQQVEEEVREKILCELDAREAQKKRKAEEAAQEEARKKADEAASVGKVDQATIVAAQTKYQGKKAPLCAALEAEDEDAAEALLDGGADPNEVDGDGYNALHRAAEKGCRPPLLQRVLARIHDVNAGNKYGWTALMYAARYNHLDVVTSLLNHPGIDVNVQDSYNDTALHEAIYKNHPAIVSQLLSDDNINVNLKNCNNNTPLKRAIEWKKHKCVKILQDYGAKEE